MYVVIATIFGE